MYQLETSAVLVLDFGPSCPPERPKVIISTVVTDLSCITSLTLKILCLARFAHLDTDMAFGQGRKLGYKPPTDEMK